LDKFAKRTIKNIYNSERRVKYRSNMRDQCEKQDKGEGMRDTKEMKERRRGKLKYINNQTHNKKETQYDRDRRRQYGKISDMGEVRTMKNEPNVGTIFKLAIKTVRVLKYILEGAVKQIRRINRISQTINYAVLKLDPISHATS
jgi:hypothetical protein